MPPYHLAQATGYSRGRETVNVSMSCGKCPRLSPREVAERLVTDEGDNEILLVDCRSLVAFNVRHIKGAIHINCSGILRKRLTQGKAKLKDLISSAEGKERFASESSQRTLVVYDELSSGHGCEECGPCRPICLVQETLIKEGRTISVLKGGLKEFCKDYESLCENTSPRFPLSSQCDFPPSPICPSPSSICPSTSPGSCPQRPKGTPVTAVLPFLFLGNEEGAADEDLINRLEIKYVLNITPKCPNYFSERSDMHYKQIKIHDSNQEDIGQYFEEAIQFIEEARERGCGVLVHCYAGVSRSATVTVAYVMKHLDLALNEAYKFVKDKRPVISPNLNFMGHLLKYEKNWRNEK